MLLLLPPRPSVQEGTRPRHALLAAARGPILQPVHARWNPLPRLNALQSWPDSDTGRPNWP
jgi:hypothetical protein